VSKLRVVVAVVVVGAAAAVLLGVGQGSPPARSALSAKARTAQLKRVDAGGHGVQAGRNLFTSTGCGSCHTIAASNSEGTLGPRLDVVLKGTPRAAIEEFIINPKIVKLPGYDNNLMPRNYSKRLSGGQIRALASYLHASAG
jgi:mono/diheme cytochrome c family protein